MRRKVVAGNWKMNMTPSEAVALVKKLKPNMENSDVDVIFCVPSIDIVPVVEACKVQKSAWELKICIMKKRSLYR